MATAYAAALCVATNRARLHPRLFLHRPSRCPSASGAVHSVLSVVRPGAAAAIVFASSAPAFGVFRRGLGRWLRLPVVRANAYYGSCGCFIKRRGHSRRGRQSYPRSTSGPVTRHGRCGPRQTGSSRRHTALSPAGPLLSGRPSAPPRPPARTAGCRPCGFRPFPPVLNAGGVGLNLTQATRY